MNLKKTVVVWVGVPMLAVAVMGCGGEDGEDVRQARVPKESRSAVAAEGGGAVAGQAARAAREEIAWEVPASWKRLPGGEQQMRYATFQVSEANPDVVVTVVPLGGESGSLVGNVNRWEGQLGLPATPENDLGKITRTVETGAGPATMVDLKSAAPAAAQKPLRLIAAVVKRGEVTWFFKLAGPAEVVDKEAANFEAFTKSTHFAESHAGHAHAEPAAPAGQVPATGTAANLPAGHPPTTGVTTPSLPADHPPLTGAPPAGGAGGAGGVPAAIAPASVAGMTYDLPEGWALQPARPMRDATFTAGSGDKTVEVVVSHFPQGVGDFLSNVNRWRQQVGLGPVNNVDPKTFGEAVRVGAIEGRLYDFTGTGAAGGAGGAPAMRQMVATVNKGGFDWFFKIIGPAEVVESQKQAFVRFLSSVRLGE